MSVLKQSVLVGKTCGLGDGTFPVATTTEKLHPLDLSARVEMVLDTLSVWNTRRRQRQQLRTLPDNMLRDIGVSRLDAEAEAAKPFWRA